MPYRTPDVARLHAFGPPGRNVAQRADETVGSPDGRGFEPLLDSAPDGGSVGPLGGLDGALDEGELGSDGGQLEGELGSDGGELASVGPVPGVLGGPAGRVGVLGSAGELGRAGAELETDEDDVHHHVARRGDAGRTGGATAPARELATAGTSWCSGTCTSTGRVE